METGKKLECYDKYQKPFRTDTSDGDKDMEASFYILTKTMCPAVLVECMFQDNKSDVEFLLSNTGKHAIERTLVEGILKYVES